MVAPLYPPLPSCHPLPALCLPESQTEIHLNCKPTTIRDRCKQYTMCHVTDHVTCLPRLCLTIAFAISSIVFGFALSWTELHNWTWFRLHPCPALPCPDILYKYLRLCSLSCPLRLCAHSFEECHCECHTNCSPCPPPPFWHHPLCCPLLYRPCCAIIYTSMYVVYKDERQKCT